MFRILFFLSKGCSWFPERPALPTPAFLFSARYKALISVFVAPYHGNEHDNLTRNKSARA